VFSAIIGVGITKLFHLNPDFENLRWVAGALSVGLASAFMGLTNTIHPPAGATALLAATTPEITELGWYLVPLIMLGSVLLVAVGCITNNIQRQFPMYCKAYFHSNLLFFLMGAESLGAISGAGMIRLFLCLRSQDSFQALSSFTLSWNLQR
jgi:hypothetical protein